MAKSKAPKKLRFVASNIDIWYNCAASLQLMAKLPQPPSDARADEGSLGHSIAEKCFRTGSAASYFINRLTPEEKKKAQENNWSLQAMTDYVQEYVDFCRDIHNDVIRTGGKPTQYIEHRFELKQWHKDFRGVMDYGLDDNEGRFTVIDFKYGKWQIDPKENKQLILYALGALDLGFYEEIDIGVYQPRGYDGAVEEPARFWQTTPEELEDWGHKFVEKAKLATKENAKPTEGSHCHFCWAKEICPAKVKHVKKVLNTDFQKDAPELTDVNAIPDERLSEILTLKPQIDSWFAAVQQRAEFLVINQNRKIPGLKKVYASNRRYWANEEKAASFLEERLGDFAYVEPEAPPKRLLSVAEAEKMMDSKTDKKKLDAFVGIARGQVKVVPDEDARVELLTAEDEFDEIDVEGFDEDIVEFEDITPKSKNKRAR